MQHNVSIAQTSNSIRCSKTLDEKNDFNYLALKVHVARVC